MPRDAARTKRRILDAAVECFAHAGFAGTSTRTIAARAQVSLPLLQRYFGSKQGLFDAVVSLALEEYEHIQASQWALPEDDITFFVEGIATMFDWYRDRADWMRLWAWVRLEHQRFSSPPLEAYWARLEARMIAAQRAGVIRSDLDPMATLIAIDLLVKGHWERRHCGTFAFLEPEGGAEELDRRMLLMTVTLIVRSAFPAEHADAAVDALRERLCMNS